MLSPAAQACGSLVVTNSFVFVIPTGITLRINEFIRFHGGEIRTNKFVTTWKRFVVPVETLRNSNRLPNGAGDKRVRVRCPKSECPNSRAHSPLGVDGDGAFAKNLAPYAGT